MKLSFNLFPFLYYDRGTKAVSPYGLERNVHMKMKIYIRKLLCTTVIITMLMGMTACTISSKDSGKLSIVTTLFPQYDFVKQIAGDKAEVTLLLSPGIEAHSYDPTPSDIVKINESDLFIYTGEYMETWAAQIIKSLEKDVTILDVSEGIELTSSEDEHNEINHDETELEDHNHVYDPHIWTSPVNAQQMVKTILNELVRIDAENEDYYRKNADSYLAELEELDASFRQVVENADIHTLYFADKFAMYYFTSEYGLSYVSAYDSCSSETEPSAKLVAKMIDEVKEDNAPAVFYAELSNHKAADTISKETGTKELLLHSCHNVSKDEFKDGATYISLMKQNLENLKVGLYRE